MEKVHCASPNRMLGVQMRKASSLWAESCNYWMRMEIVFWDRVPYNQMQKSLYTERHMVKQLGSVLAISENGSYRQYGGRGPTHGFQLATYLRVILSFQYSRLCLPSAGSTLLHFPHLVCTVVGTELGFSCTLGRFSTNWAPEPHVRSYSSFFSGLTWFDHTMFWLSSYLSASLSGTKSFKRKRIQVCPPSTICVVHI